MCGIAGLMVRHGCQRAEVQKVRDALVAMAHRGPDDEGIIVLRQRSVHRSLRPRTQFTEQDSAETGDAILGHVRLAIIDTTDAGHQPMEYGNGRLWLTYNGEIYNYRELRDELVAKGYRFQTHTDSEVILAAYAEWGIQCFDRFNGMWGLAIYDTELDELILARDRFGVKPLYYTELPWGWAFASELKGVLSIHGQRPRLNIEKLAHYFATTSSFQNEDTWFSDVRQLLGGHFLRVTRYGATLRRWYDFPQRVAEQDPPSDSDEAAQKLRFLLVDAVRLRLRSDVPVGACLSGGLDSSTLVMLMSRELAAQGGGPVKTFTYASDCKSLDESPYAMDVVRAARGDPAFIRDEPKRLFDELDRFVFIHDEPVSNPSIYAQWQVMRLARQNSVPVLLDGQGGDENFLGYEPYYSHKIVSLLKNFRLASALREYKSIQKHMSLPPARLIRTGLYHSIPSLHAYYRRRRARTLLCRRLPSDLDLSSELAGDDWRLRQITSSPIPHLLKYEDRNSMAFSIETRLPMLDYRVVEYSQTLPESYLLRAGRTKWLLRHSMKDILPPSILNRRDKIGFQSPVRKLLEAVKERAQPLILDRIDPIDDLLNQKMLRIIAQDLGRHSRSAWLVINVKSWARVFNVTI